MKGQPIGVSLHDRSKPPTKTVLFLGSFGREGVHIQKQGLVSVTRVRQVNKTAKETISDDGTLKKRELACL